MKKALLTSAAIASLMLAVSSCATGDGDVASNATNLTITYQVPDATNPEMVTQSGSWEINCATGVGTHPDVESACQDAEEIPLEAYEPVPADQACTMIFGGGQTATIQGQVKGKDINAQFSLQNGCEIARWDSMRSLLAPVPTDIPLV